jgi:VanZ family protein
MLSAWVPVLICVLVIATESTPVFGADHTTGPLRRLFEHLFGPIAEAQWLGLHIFIRKTGHFTGYGILSLAWFRACWMTWPFRGYPIRSWIAPHGLAMLGTLFIASSDEFHQTFLPNRTGSFRDVMTDCTGGLVAQLAVLLWMRRRRSADGARGKRHP